jgi:uncharacterized BrkB/YihY/UPF0761 family membrane protein
MRRIYYAYVLRVAFQPAIVQGFFMLALLIALTYFVSLGSIIQNISQIRVGYLGTYFYNALTNTDAWTLLILGLMIFSVFTLRFTIAPVKRVPKFVEAQ